MTGRIRRYGTERFFMAYGGRWNDSGAELNSLGRLRRSEHTQALSLSLSSPDISHECKSVNDDNVAMW